MKLKRRRAVEVVRRLGPLFHPIPHSIAAIYVPIALIAVACDCERIRVLPRGFCRCGLPLVVGIPIPEGEGFGGFRMLLAQGTFGYWGNHWVDIMVFVVVRVCNPCSNILQLE